LIEPTDNALLDIDYIRIAGRTTKAFDVTAMNTYRLAVKDQNVDLYINDSISPIMSEKLWLDEIVNSKKIVWGKVEQSEKQVKLSWKGIRLYTSGNLSPYQVSLVNWTYMAAFANGSEVQNLLESRDSLVAMIKPVRIAKEFDTIYDLNPRSYRLESSSAISWVADATYPSDVVQLIASTNWGEDIYSSGQTGSISNNITNIDLVIIIDNASRTTSGQLTNMVDLAKSIVDELRLNKNNNYDNIAIVTTDESNSYPTSGIALNYSSDKVDVYTALDAISTGSQESSMDNALLYARSILATSVERGGGLDKYVLILSDGNFTAPIQSNSVSTADLIRDDGSSVICIGFNDDDTPQVYSLINLTEIANTDMLAPYDIDSKDFTLLAMDAASRDIITTSKVDIINTIVIDGILTQVGNLYNRRKTHSYDEIIKDTTPPEVNLVIKPNESAGGIRVYELNIFVEDISEDNV
jgi:hypothetical protein